MTLNDEIEQFAEGMVCGCGHAPHRHNRVHCRVFYCECEKGFAEVVAAAFSEVLVARRATCWWTGRHKYAGSQPAPCLHHPVPTHCTRCGWTQGPWNEYGDQCSTCGRYLRPEVDACPCGTRAITAQGPE